MPQVELAPLARLALVAGDDGRLDADGRRNDLFEQVFVRAQPLERHLLEQGESSGSPTTPALTASARPARNSRSGSVASIDTSHTTNCGCEKVPTIFL